MVSNSWVTGFLGILIRFAVLVPSLRTYSEVSDPSKQYNGCSPFVGRTLRHPWQVAGTSPHKPTLTLDLNGPTVHANFPLIYADNTKIPFFGPKNQIRQKWMF